MQFFHQKPDEKAAENKEEHVLEYRNIEETIAKNIVPKDADESIGNSTDYPGCDQETTPECFTNDVNDIPVPGHQAMPDSTEKEAKLPERCSELQEDDLKRLLIKIFHYGYQNATHIREYLETDVAIRNDIQNFLDVKIIEHERYYFHTDSSLKRLAELTGENFRSLKKSAVFYDQYQSLSLPDIDEEIGYSLVLEEVCKDSIYDVEDRVSNKNPNYQKSLKIRYQSRSSLTPDFLTIVRKNNQRNCLLFHILPTHEPFIIGEKRRRYFAVIDAYQVWLRNTEKKEKWLKKLKLDVPVGGIAVVLIVPYETHLFNDVQTRLKANIALVATTREQLLKAPATILRKCFVKTSGQGTGNAINSDSNPQ